MDSTRTVSAFMFRIEDHILIEFSDPGYAFYAYLHSNKRAPSLESNKIRSIDELRDGSLPQLVYRSGLSLHNFSKHGRLSHVDGELSWEYVFGYWLSKIANVNV